MYMARAHPLLLMRKCILDYVTNTQNLSIAINASCFLIAGYGQPNAAKEQDRQLKNKRPT